MAACGLTWADAAPRLPHGEHRCVFRIATAAHDRHECSCGAGALT